MTQENVIYIICHMLGQLVKFYDDHAPWWVGTASIVNVELYDCFLLASDVVMKLPSLPHSLMLLSNHQVHPWPWYLHLIQPVPHYFLAESLGAVLIQWVLQHSGHVRHGIALGIALHPRLHHRDHLMVAESAEDLEP